MKNIAILSAFVIMLFLFSAITPAFSQHNQQFARSYGFSVGAQTGFVYGQAGEYVYPTNTLADLLSELLWDMKPVFYWGIALDFGLIDFMEKPGFFASLSFKSGIAGDSGKMEDRDWKSILNTDLTNYSEHINRTREFFWLDAAAGASIPVRHYFYIKPFLSFSWMRFAFTARDGFYQYATEVIKGIYLPIEDAPKTPVQGEVVKYEQDWIILAPGFKIGMDFLSFISVDLSFQISPFAFCIARDDHLITQTVFLDYTGWGLFLEPRVNLTFKWDSFSISLEAAYRFISKTTGYTHMRESPWHSYVLSANASGASLSIFDARLIARLRF
ncbi:MAG: omptin family outer membrane protease [Treponema sp.]|nr:omptin family outer membrane protease [Treponema sp.]